MQPKNQNWMQIVVFMWKITTEFAQILKTETIGTSLKLMRALLSIQGVFSQIMSDK